MRSNAQGFLGSGWRRNDGQFDYAPWPSGRGRFSGKTLVKVDGLGNPLRFVPTGGQENDITPAAALLPGHQGKYVIADEGYDARRLRECIVDCWE